MCFCSSWLQVVDFYSLCKYRGGHDGHIVIHSPIDTKPLYFLTNVAFGTYNEMEHVFAFWTMCDVIYFGSFTLLRIKGTEV